MPNTILDIICSVTAECTATQYVQFFYYIVQTNNIIKDYSRESTLCCECGYSNNSYTGYPIYKD